MPARRTLLACAVAAGLCAPAALAQGGFNLERVPEPPILIPDEAQQRLKKEKHNLDGRYDGVKTMFDGYQSACRSVERSRTAPCRAQRQEVVAFAAAYIRASCEYKRASAQELDKLIAVARTEIAGYQEQIRRIGIDATGKAHQQWEEVSQEQLEALAKEGLSASVDGLVTAVAGLGEMAAVPAAARVLTPEQAAAIVDAMKRRGVTDERLLDPIRELPNLLEQPAREQLARTYVEAVKANVQLQLKEQEIRKSSDSFERAWAAVQAGVVVFELIGKRVASAAAASPGQAVAAGTRVSVVAAAAPIAIQVAGHWTIGHFWTYRSMRELAWLPDVQLVQIQVLAGLMEGPVDRIRRLKARRAPFVGDKRCGT